MKTRQGFVSNSSSSSFIIGLGVVTAANVPSVEAELKKNGSDYSLIRVADLVDGTAKRWDMKVNLAYDMIGNATLEKIEMEAFDYSTAELRQNVLKDLSGEDYIMVLDVCEGDDSDFWDEESGYYDYDIDLDHFSDSANEALSVLTSLEHNSWTYGAGRNG